MRLILPAVALLATTCMQVPEKRLSSAERAACNAPDDDGILINRVMRIDCLEYGPSRRASGMLYWSLSKSGVGESTVFEPGVRVAEKFRERATKNWIIFDEADLAIAKPLPGCTKVIYLEFDGRKAVRHVPQFELRRTYNKVERVLTARFEGYASTYVDGSPVGACRD